MKDLTSPLEDLIEYAIEHGWSRSRRQLAFRLSTLFQDIDLNGRSFLDIGGGNGLLTLYAACMGARSSVCLEPEGAGSLPGSSTPMLESASHLKLNNVELVHSSFQDYDARNQQFDIVMMHASVNHLDESACITLLTDSRSRGVYRNVFGKCASLMHKGGKLIIHEITPKNFFVQIGLPHPMAKLIEWHKHHTPDVWIDLLEECGFRLCQTRWLAYDRLGHVGQFILGNKLGSYMISGRFDLVAELV